MKLSLWAAVVMGAALLAAAPPPKPPPAPSFTLEQANRGQLEFYEHCAECHGAKAQGHYGPALIGSDGNVQWYTVKYIYQYSLYQMPHGNPGALPKSVYVDIVAYLLKMHGNRPGKKALTPAVANSSTALFGPP